MKKLLTIVILSAVLGASAAIVLSWRQSSHSTAQHSSIVQAESRSAFIGKEIDNVVTLTKKWIRTTST